MAMRIVKIGLVGLMLAGIIFSLFNFIAVKSEAYAIWQQLEEGIDPVTGGKFIRCFSTGQSCVTVYPYEN